MCYTDIPVKRCSERTRGHGNSELISTGQSQMCPYTNEIEFDVPSLWSLTQRLSAPTVRKCRLDTRLTWSDIIPLRGSHTVRNSHNSIPLMIIRHTHIPTPFRPPHTNTPMPSSLTPDPLPLPTRLHMSPSPPKPLPSRHHPHPLSLHIQLHKLLLKPTDPPSSTNPQPKSTPVSYHILYSTSEKCA
jgi:hypothetical protein